jgi:hypothetical protein
MRPLVTALAVLLLAAAPAAAEPWSPPGDIPGTSQENSPVLAMDAAGPRAVYWAAAGVPANPAAFTPSTFVSPLGPGFVPAAGAQLSPVFQIVSSGGIAGVDDLAVVGGHGRVVLPAQPRARPGTGAIATGPLAGPLRVRDLPAPVRAVAVNAAGDAAVLVEPCATRACKPAAPMVMVRRRGRRFGPLVALDRRGLDYGASLAIDPRGRVLAAWDRGGRVYARFVGPRGRLGRIQALGPEEAPPIFHVALSADGRAAVAWASQRRGETGAGGPFTATLALAGPRRRFGRPRVLETVPQKSVGDFGVPHQGLVVRLPAGAPGLVAWTGLEAGGYVVRAAPIVGTKVGAAQTLSEAAGDSVLADAAEGPRGEAVVLELPHQGDGGLVAVTRPAGASGFGAPEQIVAAPTFVDGAEVAVDSTSGAAFATWRTVALDRGIGWSVRAPIG